MQETHVQSLGWADPLGKGMVTHSSTFAWRIPWTEEPSRLQSMGSQRVRHTEQLTHFHVNAVRQGWYPVAPSRGQTSCQTCKWTMSVDQASLVAQLGKNPPAMLETVVRFLRWEEPLEKGKATHSSILAWRIPWTIVHGVAKSWTQLSRAGGQCCCLKLP